MLPRCSRLRQMKSPDASRHCSPSANALEKELADAKTALALSGGGGPKAEAEEIGGVTFMGQVISGIEPKALRGLADEQMKAIGVWRRCNHRGKREQQHRCGWGFARTAWPDDRA